MSPRRFFPLLLLMSALLLCAGALCRYTVRDVGFVVLDEQDYTLKLPSDADERLRHFCRALYLDAPLGLQMDEVQEATLKDAQGRELRLVDWPAGATAMANVLDSVSAVLHSSARSRLLKIILDAHGIVVFVEGSDTAANARVLKLCSDAIERSEPILADLPKRSKVGPMLLRISGEERGSERVFLFSMGFDEDAIDGGDPLVAVLFGRGSLMGEPLAGPLITRTAILESLSLVGQDCECDLDRSVMQGRRALLNWDDETRQRAQESLGFDPDNPLVRAEVSRILSRGRTTGRRDDSTWGYSETDIPPAPEPEAKEDEPVSMHDQAAHTWSDIYLVLLVAVSVLIMGAALIWWRWGREHH